MGAERALDTRAQLTASRRPRLLRYFFVGFGGFGIVVAIVGFAPSLYAYFVGDLFIPPIAHVHGALMLGWVVLYTVQGAFAANGTLSRHRRLGWAATALAAAVWISMGVAQIGSLTRFDPDVLPFLTKSLLTAFGLMVVFPVLVTWAVLARRNADWHKRLMTFATFVLLQAAVDRMRWLPHEGLPMFWHFGLRLYVLMIPLFVFDFVTLRRIHPATLTGSAIVVAMHAVFSIYWEHEGWNQLARSFWISLR